jgi:alkanesulfonate monooxygenase SsuD/methylene tetrahydromethanopterin reductase-like flavin-dependent oxidoreductase (luciferase family)
MIMRRRGVALTPMETRHDIILRTAQLADELGYEAFALPEGWGLDATLLLTEVALRTRRIKVVSGILSVWGRTPGTLAMTAATLHRLSAGRYVLGLGPSTKALVEGFHDQRFVHPAGKLREVTSKVRALLAGERAQLDTIAGARPLRLGQPAAPEVPIWLAAMGERTVRVAAELADGWFPCFLARDQVTERASALRKHREAAGQRDDPLTVVAGPMTVAGDDAALARRIAASGVAWYLCAMGDVYARFVTEQGYGGAVQAILAANPRPSPDSGIVPAEAEAVLDQFAAHGTPGQVREQLDRWDGAVDLTMIGLPRGLPWPSSRQPCEPPPLRPRLASLPWRSCASSAVAVGGVGCRDGRGEGWRVGDGEARPSRHRYGARHGHSRCRSGAARCLRPTLRGARRGGGGAARRWSVPAGSRRRPGCRRWFPAARSHRSGPGSCHRGSARHRRALPPAAAWSAGR